MKQKNRFRSNLVYISRFKGKRIDRDYNNLEYDFFSLPLSKLVEFDVWNGLLEDFHHPTEDLRVSWMGKDDEKF